MSSPVIVLASFIAVAGSTETVPGPPGEQPTYRPVLTWHFRADEYLKGSGPSEFYVEARAIGGEEFWEGGQRYSGYLTETKAQAEADRLIRERNTAYDDRPGVLFLRGPLQQLPSGSRRSNSSNSFNFVLLNTFGQSSFAVSVDSMSRSWLPYSNVPRDGGTTKDDKSIRSTPDPEIITNKKVSVDTYGEPSESEDPPSMSLSELKVRIGEIDAMIAAGNGTDEYLICLYYKLVRKDYYRYWTPLPRENSLTAGLPAGTELRRSPDTLTSPDYHAYYTSGPDSVLFKGVVIDDDSDPSNGFLYAYSTARPLPAGEYEVNFHHQHYRNKTCGFKPGIADKGYSNYNVTVTAPAGTLHEAFFDPVGVGTAVGADAANGKLEPRAFEVDGESTESTSLEWNDGRVEMASGAWVSLGGYVLEFIALDGSVSLSLSVEEATLDEGQGAYTWDVLTQPWAEGDLLMLRIREG